MKRLLATLLVVTLVICSLSAPVLAETDNYANAIGGLYLYLRDPKNSGVDIKSII